MATNHMTPETTIATLDAEGLHFATTSSGRDAAAQAERKSISPSMITGIQGCPARWAAQTFVIDTLIPRPVDDARARGSLFHKVMEVFFGLEPQERTRERLQRVIQDVFDGAEGVVDQDEFSPMKDIPEVVEWLSNAIDGYYEMGADPRQVQIATLSRHGRDVPGLEAFVKGHIGDAKRDVLGFVDRISVHPKGGYVVEDWKTGKPHQWNPDTSSDDGLAEQRQQILYTMLLRQQGETVTSARLIYPCARTIVKVHLDNDALVQRVVDDVSSTDEALTSMMDANTFDYHPSYLCAWCPLAKVCPQATIKPYPKMQAAYESQPDYADLSAGLQCKS